MTARRPIALAVVVLATLPLAAQRFHSGVDAVRVDALVTDGRRPIAGLTAADFELRDNGVVQQIDAVSRESLPLSIMFVLDTSGSVAGRKMANLAAAVDVIVKRLREGDRSGLVTFSHRVWQRLPLGANLDRMRAVVSAVEADGGTALRDAVYAGLALGATEDTRPLVVVFSDGVDNASWLPEDAIERAARRAPAVVYGVAVAARSQRVVNAPLSPFGAMQIDNKPYYLPNQTAFLDAIASITGGRVLRADTTDNLPRAFNEIIEEFRTRYVLAYSPRGVDAGGWHTIDLRVTRGNAEIRARRGYQR